MTYRETELLFIDALKDIYPAEEIHAIYRWIFETLFHMTPFEMHLKSQEDCPPGDEAQIYNIIRQLKLNKPIQYILGETEFYGLNFSVNENVLIPRPETEELVQWIIDDNKNRLDIQIIDIGTGTGCIAIALAKFLPNSVLTALDVSSSAIELAKINSAKNNIEVNFIVKDILDSNSFLKEKYDIIVSNPPYIDVIQKKQMLPNVLNYEPHLALFAPENDPLIFYKKIGLFARENLKKKGALYFEINEIYPHETAQLLGELGFQTQLKKDINEKFRMVKAWKNE
jgi:release factor glutamine methyltransferase